MIVVFDSNVWLKSFYLNSSVASSVKYFLHKEGIQVGLPEVIRLEVKTHLNSSINDICRDINHKHNQLLDLFHRLKAIIIPTETEINSLVARFFATTGITFQDVPFSEKAARESFLRTIEKRPPSHKRQQFKDGVLWYNCKELLDTDNVTLVTEDKAFFENDIYKNGLSKELKLEIESFNHKLTLLPSIDDLLASIRQKVDIENIVFEDAVVKFLQTHVDQQLSSAGLSQSSRWEFKRELFVTERPTLLYASFVGTISCDDISGDGKKNCVMCIKGNGTIDTATQAFIIAQLNESSVSYVRADGVEETINSSIARAFLDLGHPIVRKAVRVPLNT